MRALQLGPVMLVLTVPLLASEHAANPAASARPPAVLAGTASLSTAIPQNINVRQNVEAVLLTPFSRFVDAINATFRINVDGTVTHVEHVRHPSDVVFIKGIFGEGGSSGWHTHAGPNIIVVQSGVLGVVHADDCVVRTYEAGQALMEWGEDVHVGFNAASEGETVIFIAFLGVTPGVPVTIPAADPGCF